MNLLKHDLDSVKHPSIKHMPPFYLYEYCERVLLDLEKLPEKQSDEGTYKVPRIGLLCGMADDLFQLGVSVGIRETKMRVTKNLFGNSI